MTEVAPVRRLLSIRDAAQCLPYSEKAMRRKIETGIWLDGYEYHRAPDGRIIVNKEGVETWLRGERRIGHSDGAR